tara:strand:- start:349 stop:1806 length:1458 start_codon:yes stop_codon:yes gene_type:complete
MKAQLTQPIDFNQMLIFSVFLHLAILTFVLFLPKPSLKLKPVVPAFMVNMVSIPSGKSSPVQIKPTERKQAKIKKEPAKNKQEIIKKSKPFVKNIKKMEVVKKAVKKQSKPETNKIMNALKDLDKKAAAITPLPSKKMLEELDQLAKLEQPKKLVAKPKKKRTALEKTFRELNKLKDKKIKIAKKNIPKPVVENLLEGFDNLKMEEVVDRKEINKPRPVITNHLKDIDALKVKEGKKQKGIEKQQPVIKNLLENFDDLKVEEVVEKKQVVKKPQSVKEKIDKETVPLSEKRNLLNELENLAKLDLTRKEEKGTAKKVVVEDKPNKVYASALKKLESISVTSSRVEVEIADAKLDESKFQSKLRTLPDTPTKKELLDDIALINSQREDVPSAEAQAIYAGLVREIIYKNWRDPLAEQHSKEAIISFRIFSKGNIDKPFVKRSSGVEVLDTLAVRAVLDSVPFPQFPKELKKSNLLLSIHFKYVPKN